MNQPDVAIENTTDQIDIDAFVKAFLDLDWDYLETICHEEMRWKNPGLPAMKGRARIRRTLERLISFAPKFELELINCRVIGNDIIR